MILDYSFFKILDTIIQSEAMSARSRGAVMDVLASVVGGVSNLRLRVGNFSVGDLLCCV